VIALRTSPTSQPFNLPRWAERWDFKLKTHYSYLIIHNS
jgi:hypothetical protein